MADLPILFSTPMVRAILREIERPGTGKTQTRRVITQPFLDGYYEGEIDCTFVPAPASNITPCFRFSAPAVGGGAIRTEVHELRYQVGDRLYVREHWRAWSQYDRISPRDIPAAADVQYVADDPLSPWDSRFRQAMHMPRWASRLTLTVTDVRVQRLQEISPEDCRAEGHPTEWQMSSNREVHDDAARDWFADLWDSINGDRPGLAWKYNPWVAAISFRPHLINIDTYLERNT
jgi:hypothetical protein